MKRALKILGLVVCVVGLSWTQVAADWQSGDGHKMHFPQLPDENGWDVRADEMGVIVADDWLCTETGRVTGIHFWGSWKGGEVGQFLDVEVGIWPDDRTGEFSKPGLLPLWSERLGTRVEIVPVESSAWQGWYDPTTGIFNEEDHQGYFQYNVTIPEAAAFLQQEGTIYWLSIWVQLEDPINTCWGWKSSVNHYEDDAVWAEPPVFQWQELYEPPYFEQSMDMAFVITPEPATVGLLVLGIGGLLLRRKRP